MYKYLVKSVSCSVMSNSVSPWTVACQAPLSMEFSRQEYWSRLPFPSPEDLPDAGIYPTSPTLHADSLPSEPTGKPMLVNLNKVEKFENHLPCFIRGKRWFSCFRDRFCLGLLICNF